MASGSYAKKPESQKPTETRSPIPRRATRQLSSNMDETDLAVEERELERGMIQAPFNLPFIREEELQSRRPTRTVASPITPTPESSYSIEEFEPHYLERRKPWMNPLLASIVVAVVFTFVILSAGIFQRPGVPQPTHLGGKVYDIQVGGDLATTWQGDKPMEPKQPIPASTGPYSVLGKPTVNVDFINRVLAEYKSPAAGKGQALYDLGIQYGIDPVYALAFFMHESGFGTQGQARTTLSLGNLRCIPTHPCVDEDRGGYAQMKSWEDGFETWYKLIRNLYVAQWERVTVDQIIPKYAPNSDNNNEQGYIKALKTAVDAWRAGQIRV